MRAAAGVAMIYQELNLAADLTVVENVMLGQERTALGFVRRAAQRDRVRRVLAMLGRADLPLDAPVRSLSVADRQLVEIARALAIEAKLIVFDEPTSSLIADMTHENLFRVIGQLQTCRHRHHLHQPFSGRDPADRRSLPRAARRRGGRRRPDGRGVPKRKSWR